MMNYNDVDWAAYRGDQPAFWRLPIVRHVRFFWYAWRVAGWQRAWGGIGTPTGWDETVLHAIRRGDA